MLPQRSWETIDLLIKRIGEKEFLRSDDRDDLVFLKELGLATSPVLDLTDGETLLFLREVVADTSPLAGFTERGHAYFLARFVQNRQDDAREILTECLANFPPAEAIVQLLRGGRDTTRANAESALRATGHHEGLNRRTLGTFLVMLDMVGLVAYNRQAGAVHVQRDPAEDAVPKDVFLSPETPYSNVAWLRAILAECEQYIYWLDKHFYAVGFEHIWRTADASRVSEIRILSADLGDNLDGPARDDYRRLRDELAGKGISLEWRVLPRKQIKDTHDRWIIGEDYLRNVPPIRSIHLNQRAEMTRSANHAEALAGFERYWAKAVPV